MAACRRAFATQVAHREGLLDRLWVRSSMPQVPLTTPFPGVKVPTEYAHGWRGQRRRGLWFWVGGFWALC